MLKNYMYYTDVNNMDQLEINVTFKFYFGMSFLNVISLYIVHVLKGNWTIRQELNSYM